MARQTHDADDEEFDESADSLRVHMPLCSPVVKQPPVGAIPS